MAHLAEGSLRRMVDDPDAAGRAQGALGKAASDARHLEGCAECQARYKTVADDAHAITSLLAVPEAGVDVARAFDRVRSTPAAQPRFGFRLPLLPPITRPVSFALVAAVAAVALLVGVAAQNLNIFSPSTVTPVPVTVADMQALSQLSAYGTVTWTTQPQLQVLTTAAEAASISGLQAPVVVKLPAGVPSTVTYAAMSRAVAVFTFSADTAKASAAGAGKALPPLPAGMDGAKLTVTVGPAVGEIYGNLKLPSGSSVSSADLPRLVVGKSTAPSATSTQVSVKQMEDYILAQPGISKQLADAIKAIDQPDTTLPIPIPIQFATSSKVQVQGVQGVALGDNTGVGSAVIWVKNGTVYAVAGTIKQSDAINIANNLK